MKMMYVAVNGDGVGEKIGNAILSDDHQGLSSLSRKFKDAHGAIEKWAQKRGGEVVASAGDESIFSLPAEAVGELESIKNNYAQNSGGTLTIGVGETISQASKALIYGKLNDKNQIVEYEPQMDDYLSDSDEGQEEDQGQEEIPSPDDLDESASEEGRQEEGVEGEEENTEPPHEQGMSPEENMVHDAEEQEDDEQDDDNIEADAEPEVFGGNTEPIDEDVDQDIEDDIENQVGDELEDPQAETGDVVSNEDEDGFEDQDPEEFGDVNDGQGESDYSDENEGQEFGDADEIPDTDGESDYNDEDIPELTEDDIDGGQGQEEGQEEQEDGSDADSFLNEMMHSNMEGEEEQDPETAELKQKIFTALQSLKENKDMLDQIKVQNPELYQGIIANIQSMIDMGRKLGMGSQPEQEEQDPSMQGDEALDQGTEPQLEMESEEEQDPSMQGDELEDEDEMQSAPIKKPQGRLPA